MLAVLAAITTTPPSRPALLSRPATPQPQPQRFGLLRVSVAQQKIAARFVARVKELADLPEYRARLGSDRDTRIKKAFSEAAEKKSEMLVILAMMLSLPEMPVCSFFTILQDWVSSLPGGCRRVAKGVALRVVPGRTAKTDLEPEGEC
jgi:hypothetical protein